FTRPVISKACRTSGRTAQFGIGRYPGRERTAQLSRQGGPAMKIRTLLTQAALGLIPFLIAFAAAAADYPAPKQGDWVARDFKFHTGEVLPELRLHYTTVGEPAGEPVLILHGTTGSGGSALNPAFG